MWETPYFWTEAIRHTFTCSDARARTRVRRPATGFEMFVWLNLLVSICQNEEVTACDARTCCSATALFFALAHVFRSSSFGFVSATLMFERRVCLRHERLVPFRKMICSIAASFSSVLRCVISNVLYAFLCFSRLISSMCIYFCCNL